MKRWKWFSAAASAAAIAGAAAALAGDYPFWRVPDMPQRTAVQACFDYCTEKEQCLTASLRSSSPFPHTADPARGCTAYCQAICLPLAGSFDAGIRKGF